MAKTTYLNNYTGMMFGFAADTVVVSSVLLYDNGDPPGVIGTKVYPASMSGIGFSVLLEIGGAGQVVVSGTGSDGSGSYFTCSEIIAPATGAFIRTPWVAEGTLLVTRANNSVSISYYLPTAHDLYFRTQKISDSGSIQATVDGASEGSFSLASDTTTLDSVLIKSNLASGLHSVTITAQISSPAVFVYFHSFELLEHDAETGGEYLYQGPAGTLDDSSNNFLGQWGLTNGYAYTTDSTARIFFYPQLTAGGQANVRLQKTPDSGIVGVYVNGALRSNLDLYASPAMPLYEVTLLDAATDPPGAYEIELRHTGTKNDSSSGLFFYFHSAVVVYSRTDNQALVLAADYLRKVAALRGDGAILDAWDSNFINFDANALYACMGLLAAYGTLGDAAYLAAVKNFLIWFAGMQSSDGSWNIGYQVNTDSSPVYVPATGPYSQMGISEIKWVDAVQCLPAFVLWWYWKLSSDTVTKDALLPVIQKGIDGFIAKNYDPETGFFFSSWQNKTSPTIFLYHDAVRRHGSGGQLIVQHNDVEDFFAYSGGWSSYAPQGAINNDEHYTLNSGAYVEFSLALSGGDQLRWVTQKAWDTGIAFILVSTDGQNFTQAAAIDTYSASLELQREIALYTAPAAGTYWLRIQHSGQINAAGNFAPGWQRLASRFCAGQTDIALGMTALWMLVREPRYAALAARIIERFPGKYWSPSDTRWFISLDGAAPGNPNNFWYPMSHGYTAFGQKQSRLFQPASRFADSLETMEPFQDAEGGFHPPGYLEPEYIFLAFYLLGENQLPLPTNSQAFGLAKEYLKGGQYLLSLDGEQVGGIVFSKRYRYLYTNISGFACMALAGAVNPITEQLQISESRMVMRQ
jgi:hypothetical protein